MARYDMARYEPDTIALARTGTGATEHASRRGAMSKMDARFYELGLDVCAPGESVAIDLVSAHKGGGAQCRRFQKGCRDAIAHRAELAGEMSREEIASAQRQGP